MEALGRRRGTDLGTPGISPKAGVLTAAMDGRRRWRAVLALAGLSVLALTGQLILNQAAATIARAEGTARGLFTFGFDFNPLWLLDRYFTLGHGFALWYGKISNPYPPPHEVFFAPFSYLPRNVAQVVTIVLTAVVMVATLWLWSRLGERVRVGLRSGMWPLLLSAPVLAVVVVDQFQTAFALGALSLALWAQRRNLWWLVGPAAALGVIRVPNALPVLAMLLVGGWGKPKQLGIAVLTATAVMAPLVAVSFLWDPSWPSHYVEGIAYYPSNGLPKVAGGQLGYQGLALLALASCLCAVWLVRRNAGRPLDPGRSALGMALSVVVAPLGGFYSAIFVLPALVQLGLRGRFAVVPWIAAIGPWLVVLALAPALLGPNPYLTLTELSFIDFVLLALTYPLLRLPSEVGRSSAEPALRSSAA
jgi:hypothetical protein